MTDPGQAKASAAGWCTAATALVLVMPMAPPTTTPRDPPEPATTPTPSHRTGVPPPGCG
ncbi:hypothetical protein [Micromonospora sp. NPDC000668]|uniref:hypothetical protein n=1 Tax=Micromonospora sp. NPDC000668 TaxID=3364219 RepID=UPI0036872B58